MSYVVALPERTVDAWVSAYLGTLPNVDIWAPTQQNKPDYDLGIFAKGRRVVFEHKAPLALCKKGAGGSKTYSGPYRFEIGISQLWKYMTSANQLMPDRVWYVLPCPPVPSSRFDVPSNGQWSSGFTPHPVSAIRRQSPPFEDWAWLVPARWLWKTFAKPLILKELTKSALAKSKKASPVTQLPNSWKSDWDVLGISKSRELTLFCPGSTPVGKRPCFESNPECQSLADFVQFMSGKKSETLRISDPDEIRSNRGSSSGAPTPSLVVQFPY